MLLKKLVINSNFLFTVIIIKIMGKKFVSIMRSHKKLKIFASDLKGVHQYEKRKLPPVPSYFATSSV